MSQNQRNTPSAVPDAALNTALAAGMVLHDPLITEMSQLHGRIGIFGGTFDPVHIAHLEAARRALRESSLDMVVFIPAGQNPLKANAPIASDDFRLALLKASLESEPGLYVAGWELGAKGPSYTVELLRKIHSRISKESSLFLIVGADQLPIFHQWFEYQNILQLAKLLPVGRPGSREQPVELRADTPPEVRESLKHMVAMHMDVSARALRKQLSEGIVPAESLPPAAARQLNQKNPYLGRC